MYPAQLSDGQNFYTLTPSTDGKSWTVDQPMPDDIPLYLDLTGLGTYRVTYGAPPTPAGPKLPKILGGGEKAPLQVSLAVEATEVAAYLTEGQSVDGTLTITNSTNAPVDFNLLSTTSHFHFRVEIDELPASVDAGQTLTVPVSIQIEPDAWADIPVRITIAAEIGDQVASANAEITPTAEAPPINPVQAWPIPKDLLGGLDVASPELGATVAGTVDPDGEALLHDGVAPVGSGLSVSGADLAVDPDCRSGWGCPGSGARLHPQSDGVLWLAAGAGPRVRVPALDRRRHLHDGLERRALGDSARAGLPVTAND